MRMQINRLGMAVIEEDTHHTVWVEKTKRLDHDQSILSLLHPYLKRVAVDIGAHIGTHSIFYAEYSEIVHSFEPHPVTYECLKHNVARFNNVITYNLALSDEEKTLSMIEVVGNGGATQTRPAGETPIQCKAVTFDSIKLTECDFIKIDAEGDEIAVLEGAKKTLARLRPVMFIESNAYALRKSNHTQIDLENKIKSFGYSCRMIHPKQNPLQCDLLCLPGAAK